MSDRSFTSGFSVDRTTIGFEIFEKDGRTEIRLPDHGLLVPEYACFDSCSTAWGLYANSNQTSSAARLSALPGRQRPHAGGCVRDAARLDQGGSSGRLGMCI